MILFTIDHIFVCIDVFVKYSPVVRLAPSKSEESTQGDKSAGGLTNRPSTEGENSPKKQATLNQKVQDQSESQGQNGDTPTGRITNNKNAYISN